MILNSFILFNSCGAKLSCRGFMLALIRDLIQESGRVLQPQTTPQGWTTPSISWLEVQGNEHWPKKRNCMQCQVCSTHRNLCRSRYNCPKCNVGLYVDPCFRVYHTKSQFFDHPHTRRSESHNHKYHLSECADIF
jgi:hypothetical protein